MPDVRAGNATVNATGGETLAAVQDAAALVGQWLPVDADGRLTVAELCARRDGGPREARYGPLRARVLVARSPGCAVRHRGGQGRRGLRREARLARRDRDRARDAPARCPAALAHRRPAARRRRVRARRETLRTLASPHRPRSSCSRPTWWRSPTTRPQPRRIGASAISPTPRPSRAPRSSRSARPDWVAACPALPPARVRMAGRDARDALPGLDGPLGLRRGPTPRARAEQRSPSRDRADAICPATSRDARRTGSRGARAVSGLDLDAATSAHLDELTGTCISCGLCLPACPTFHLTREESESPRGRIELVAALQAGELTVEDVRPHLDRCLGCRACEPAVPVGRALRRDTRARA